MLQSSFLYWDINTSRPQGGAAIPRFSPNTFCVPIKKNSQLTQFPPNASRTLKRVLNKLNNWMVANKTIKKQTP